MLVDTIRDRWIDRIFENLAYNMEMIFKGKYMALLFEGQGAEKLPPTLNEPYPLLKQMGRSTPFKAAIISSMYHEVLLKKRKVPLLIGGPTIQRLLDDAKDLFSDMIEVRPVSDARAKQGYYLNPEFYREWKKNAAALAERIAEDPFADKTRDGVLLYGLENLVARKRAETVRQFAASVAEAKGNRKVLDALEKEIRATIKAEGQPEHVFMMGAQVTDASEDVMFQIMGEDVPDKLYEHWKEMVEEGKGGKK